MNSAIYVGKVFHARHVPKIHKFNYNLFMYWLDLDELPELTDKVRFLSMKKWSIVRFRRADYLGDDTVDLKQSVLQRMTELSGHPLDGKVYMLGQLRIFGLYFSPVNFYYLRQEDGTYSHMLAEVSNTPWNQRHHYLVDLATQAACEKAFHVSPFNPIDMQYHWRIQPPSESLKLTLSCVKQTKHFDASLDLNRIQLNSSTHKRVLASIPSMTIKTVVGIYWQALKLFLKGVPFYGHPGNKEKPNNAK